MGEGGEDEGEGGVTGRTQRGSRKSRGPAQHGRVPLFDYYRRCWSLIEGGMAARTFPCPVAETPRWLLATDGFSVFL